MHEPFEIEWMGGAAEHHFRKARPGIEELPWGTLNVRDFPPEIVDAARVTWTEAALTEYRAAAAFSEVLGALCAARAPLDLIGMASSFVADELVHVELASRVAMELGGGAPRPVCPADLTITADHALPPFERANELVLRVSAIGEAFSGKMAVPALRSAAHPLVRAVYERIVADESLHFRLGALYFEWASERIDDAERARLAQVAMDTLRAISSTWKRTPAQRAAVRHRATLEQIRTIGWIESRVYMDHVRAAVKDGIVAPLARYGIALPVSEVDALLAATSGC
jgi:hypothetical protein